jgi:hypothetical protein
LIGVVGKVFDFYRNFNNIQMETVLAQDMQWSTKNKSLRGFDMIFFGITLILFMALVVVAGWAFYKIHTNQFS